ncbi:MAG: TolC family protein [Acidobacteria bacterium]|nr:TolC family protein [Acidobacteriota bacterium]
MTRVVITVIVTAAATFVPSFVGAQSPLPLTVDEAVRRAVEHAPRVAEARARESAADAAIAAQAALARPALTASTGYLRTNHVDEFGIPQPDGTTRVIFPDIPTNYRARAELTMPVYTGGRVADLVRAAEAGRRAADADTRTVEADLSLAVASAYWNLAFARERIRVLERALERADAQLETVRAQTAAGVLPPNDVLSAQAQRARQQVALIQAQNDAAVGEADLARLVGLPVGQRISTISTVDEPSPAAAELAGETPDALSARALGARPERQALRDREVSLRLAAEAAAAAGRPQVGVIAAVEPARPNSRFVPRVDRWNTGWDLGVNVSWSVWDGGRARADRASSTAEANALAHRIEDFDAGVNVELRQRVLDLQAGRAALAASGDAVDAAAEARRVVGERFAAGVATSTDVLEADVALLEAELERTRLAAALRIGEARLLRAVGRRP